MIAVTDNPRSDMILLFKTLRGYLGGNVEPVDFLATGNGLEANLAALGYQRTADWKPIPDQSGSHWAPVRHA